MLKRQQDATVAGDDVVANKRPVAKPPGSWFQLAPGAARVVAVRHPLVPVGERSVVRGHKQGAALAMHHQLGRNQRRAGVLRLDAEIDWFDP